MNSESTQPEQVKKRNPISIFVRKYPFPVYVVLTLVLGWAPWYISGNPTALVFVPFLTALIVAALADGKAGVKAVLRRAIRWRAPLKIWAFVLLIPAVLGLVAIAVYTLLGGQVPQTPLLAGGSFLSQVAILAIMFLIPITGNIAEFGFRGYGLPLVQEKWGPLWGTLVLGTFFGLWLLPEFYNTTSSQYAMGGLSFLPFFVLTEIGWSYMMTWAYNKSSHSSLIAGYIFHSAFNFWTVALLVSAEFINGELVINNMDANLFKLNAVIIALAAAGFIIATKGRLGYEKNNAMNAKA
jgi:membrane protease YdiL (CAAX protease family)